MNNIINQLNNAKLTYTPQDIEEYYEDLRVKQNKHLKGINVRKAKDWRPCLHDSCEECCGTGRKMELLAFI